MAIASCEQLGLETDITVDQSLQQSRQLLSTTEVGELMIILFIVLLLIHLHLDTSLCLNQWRQAKLYPLYLNMNILELLRPIYAYT